jgi:hypothetical protein
MAEELDLVRGALAGTDAARDTLLTRTGHLRPPFANSPEFGLVILEAIFEQVRAASAPELPSRLESTFLWPTAGLARDFHQRFRAHGTIHACRIMEGVALPRDAALVVAGVDLTAMLDDEARRIEDRALRYWTADSEIAYPEVLLRGTAIVTHVHLPDS